MPVHGSATHLAKINRNTLIGIAAEDLNLPYIREWETLTSALPRLTADGRPESDAKRDLCDAIADRAISVRLFLAADQRLNLPESEVSAELFDVPAHIHPRDIDWKRSRLIKQWPWTRKPPVEPTTLYLSRVGHLFERQLGPIEVRSSEVTRVLCGTVGKAESKRPPRDESPVPRGGPVSDGIRQAIKALWPDGKLPKRAKDRNLEIIKWLKGEGFSVPGDLSRTIQRVLRTLK